MRTIRIEPKDDDSQIEVWEWKNQLYDEIKNLGKYEQFQYIIDKASDAKKNILERRVIDSK